MTKWERFLNSAAENKIDVKSCFTLIFMGAFDDILEIGNIDITDKMPLYHNAAQELKKVTKSSASLPKKLKSQSIGLNEVETPIQLIQWRTLNNPISRNRIANAFDNSLKEHGFRRQNDTKSGFLYAKKEEVGDKKTRNHLVIDSWGNFIRDYGASSVFSAFTEMSNFVLYYFVLIESSKNFKYKEGTMEAVKLSGTTGQETIPELVIWPEKDGKPPAFTYKIKPGAGHLFKLRPYKTREGEYRYVIKDIIQLMSK